MTTPCRFVSPSGIITAKVPAGCDGEATVKEIRQGPSVTVRPDCIATPDHFSISLRGFISVRTRELSGRGGSFGSSCEPLCIDPDRTGIQGAALQTPDPILEALHDSPSRLRPRQLTYWQRRRKSASCRKIDLAGDAAFAPRACDIQYGRRRL